MAAAGEGIPFTCKKEVAKGIENEHVYTKKSDIIFQDHEVTAFISAGQWRTTKGHVLVIPNEYFENLMHPIRDDVIRLIQPAFRTDYQFIVSPVWSVRTSGVSRVSTRRADFTRLGTVFASLIVLFKAQNGID